MASDTVATAFLAHVVRCQDPRATTQVIAAKRAIIKTLLRTFARKQARGARNAVVRTRRQSPALPALFVAAIVREWGSSEYWWERQIALMVLLQFCTMSRGKGITGCVRGGISWV